MAKLINVYIQDDNVEALNRQDNKSRLINDLLREHFRKIDPEQMTPEEIRKMIQIKKIEKEYKTKLERLNNGIS